MTNHNFKQLAKPGTSYQGYPNVNVSYYEAPSIPAHRDTPGFSHHASNTTSRYESTNITKETIDARLTSDHNDDLSVKDTPKEDLKSETSILSHEDIVTANSSTRIHNSTLVRPKNSPDSPVPDTILYNPFDDEVIEPPNTQPKTSEASQKSTISSSSDRTNNSNSVRPKNSLESPEPNTMLYNPFENRYSADNPEEPGSSSSSLSGRIHNSNLVKPLNSPDSPEPDTILYNPFDDKIIEVPRPTNLDLRPAPSSPAITRQPASSSSSSNKEGVPNFMSKQISIYEQHGVTVDDFREPPPAYTETDVTTTPSEPPRTAVTIIVPDPTSGLSHTASGLDRKNVVCSNCRVKVATVVHKSVGYTTHCLGLLCFFVGCWPITAWVYLGKTFKENYHFCPHCNRRVGKEAPFLGCSKFDSTPEDFGS